MSDPAQALATILSAQFPHGLPADDGAAREMVRQALVHLFTANDKGGTGKGQEQYRVKAPPVS